MKFCEDCKHIVPEKDRGEDGGLIFARCEKFTRKQKDYLTSPRFVKKQYCTEARTPVFGSCGYFAWGFEQK